MGSWYTDVAGMHVTTESPGAFFFPLWKMLCILLIGHIDNYHETGLAFLQQASIFILHNASVIAAHVHSICFDFVIPLKCMNQ